ncbi:unnamed protein product (macronuclear) [Paramecium tetraurelia]|uniref:RING-type domain-containing protein n=1 Tax=Paramecium tetraurelia TaxID=5888 RepID=A0BHH0_PARTE|nr:uncharacterized protein GSPATT00029022001 [Paramecium tetraurelia]CAK57987.1 unnamed protein product [Paramecium tetraurelia]|eukprot:XP_001425385.1 hypothetical protein (macronuclear) [Paramecium tetraurelia strain d4-2]
MQKIDSLEPTQAIATHFLDISNIEQLVQYLEKLHQQTKVEKHHTALLLNCYIKLRQFDNFIEKIEKYGFESELFDIETAIRECRSSNYLDIALKMASKKNIYQACLQIYIFDKAECGAALEYIRDTIILEEKATYLKEFGLELMRSEPQFTLEVIQNLILLINIVQNLKKQFESRKGIDSLDRLTQEQQKVWKYFNLNNDQLANIYSITFCKPDEFLHIFGGYNSYLERYLRFLIEECKNLPNEMAIFHRYFSYHLERFERKEEVKESEKRIMSLLLDDKNESKYDKNHLLVQFKIYNFTEGIICLLKKLQMREELLNFYITKKDNEEILNLCTEYGEQEQNLWVLALKYFAKPENKATHYIPNILKELSKLESISSFLILDIMKENSNVKFGQMRDFLKQQLQRDYTEIKDNLNVIKENMQQTSETRTEFQQLKTQAQIFSFGKCTACDNALVNPSFHFICGHQYHQNCIQIEDKKRICMRCNLEIQMIQNKQKEVDNSNEQMVNLRSKMLETSSKFDIISKYK